MVIRTEACAAPITLAAALFLWPALWNGYPLVFSDTGTYLSQAIEHYVGWDRPIFYSLFLFALHLTLTTWPAIIVQALLAAHVLWLVNRTLLPEFSIRWLLPTAGALSVGTALPWLVSQLMPDMFTGLLILVLALLIFVPERLTRCERTWLVLFAAFMIAAHLSHLLLALALLIVLVPLRGRLGAATPLARAGLLRLAAAPALAVVALVAVNVVGFGRASLSPFGNVFLMTRVIYDGPGMDTLRRECPAVAWKMCAFIDRLPSNADDFLWDHDGPVVQAGGAKVVSSEANAIIIAALRAEPGAEARAFIRNTLHQLTQFANGDGLIPWPDTVTPTINRDFPRAEAAAYATSLQTQGRLTAIDRLQGLHLAVALAGLAGCVLLLLALRQSAMTGFAASVLLALLVNATMTGGLSGPHDRYQSRVMWLPPLITLLALAAPRPSSLPMRS